MGIDGMIKKGWRPAFTLVELLAVMSLLSLFVAALAVSHKAPMERARLRNAQERIEGIDRRLRLTVRRSGTPVELHVEVTDGVFTVRNKEDSEGYGESYRLPPSVRLKQVYVDREQVAGKETTIRYSSSGMTPTFAIGLEGTGGQIRWILFVGATGQTVEFADLSELRPFLNLD